MLKPTVSLTEEQVRSFLDEGFLVLDAITTAEEVARIRKVYDRLFLERAGREDGNQFDLAGTDEDDRDPALPQILVPSKYAPELLESQFRTNATAVARQILGDPLKPWNEHMIYKPAGYGAATPWHQDQAYHRPDEKYKSVTIWMPLQEATVENGCLQFVPGSHEMDVLPHQSIGGDPRVHGLELADPERYTKNAVACPIPAGGATLHHSYMLHYAGANRSDVPRRAYVLVFALPPEKRAWPLCFPWQEQRVTARQRRAEG